MSQQELDADQLLRIIREIQLGRQSGVLTVQRGEGVTLEEGSITFMKGQVTQARSGRRTSAEALNWLSTWRNCRYRFVSPTLLDGTTEQEAPLQPFYPKTSGTSTPTPSSGLRERERPSLPPATAIPTPLPTAPLAPYRTRSVDDALKIITYRGLSRTHRHLLLLIDGHRSVAELLQLLRRDEREVYSLLRDLEDAAIVSVPDRPY